MTRHGVEFGLRLLLCPVERPGRRSRRFWGPVMSGPIVGASGDALNYGVYFFLATTSACIQDWCDLM